MANKKSLTIIVLIAIAFVFIMLFGKMPGQTTPQTETSTDTMPALDSSNAPETLENPEIQ